MRIEVLWTPNGGRLVVELPDHGALIRCELATDTFVEAIKRIGIERVNDAQIEVGDVPLILNAEFPHPPAQRKVGKYYITMGMAPEELARKLRQITKRLEIPLHAELFPKENEKP